MQPETQSPRPVGSSAVLAGVEPNQTYFCVLDPKGIFVHPTISLTEKEAVTQWLEQEQACNIIVNAGRHTRGESQRCSPSWEQFEAEGFRVVKVKMEAINAPAS